MALPFQQGIFLRKIQGLRAAIWSNATIWYTYIPLGYVLVLATGAILRAECKTSGQEFSAICEMPCFIISYVCFTTQKCSYVIIYKNIYVYMFMYNCM